MHHSRNTLSIFTSILAVVSFHGPSLAQAQDIRPTFSASVAVVPISAVVRDGKSRIVRDLLREDFQVLENNQPRPIVDFRATTDGPLTIALLVDTSGSMRGRNLDRAKDVVDRLLNSLNPTADQISLFTFDKTIRQETPFTRDVDSIRRGLDSPGGWGLTSLYDAVGETAKHLGAQPAERRAVVVITDGVDTSSMLTPAEVSAVASGIDVPVYVISVMEPDRRRTNAVTEESGDLSDLATWTGGALHYATASTQADKAVGALVAELRQQYFLAIESSTAAGWYRLDVTTTRRDLTVRTRSGYFSASPTSH
jgi:Ca-activated chloride channel family protein